MSTAAIIIGFRDRGVDPLRQQNLDCVADYWRRSPWPVHVVDDGLDGRAQFNRSRAYNRGTALTDADVLCYVESDILASYDQLEKAIRWAAARPGLVVPFSHQHKLGESESVEVRAGADPNDFDPVVLHDTWRSSVNHGCAGVISRRTLEAVGRWDEEFAGHGHDDTAMMIAFHVTCGPARFVEGKAHHLYHLEFDPGLTSGKHITPDDCAAQDRNRLRLDLYRRARTAAAIQQLTTGGVPQEDWRTRRVTT